MAMCMADSDTVFTVFAGRMRPHRLNFRLSQIAPRSFVQISEADRTNANACQAQYRMSDRGHHESNLPLFALAHDNL